MMKKIYAKSSSVAYMALLHAFGFRKVSLPAVAPTFFATIAKIMGIEVEFKDVNLDYSSDAAVVQNFFESFTPRAKIVFQDGGAPVGEAEVFVLKDGGCIQLLIEDEDLAKRVELFLNGGVKPGYLWNYDVVDIGIKNIAKPCYFEEEAVQRSNEIVAFLHEKFKNNPYFDIVHIGYKTIKSEYPILLKPSLYCPKEDIYKKLLERGIDVKVRFKPLYRMSLFKADFLPQSEELYKASLILPLAKEIVEPLFEVLEEFRYRGCSF